MLGGLSAEPMTRAGVQLSTSTGFDQSTKISFSFFKNGQLCGSNTSWPYAARVVGK